MKVTSYEISKALHEVGFKVETQTKVLEPEEEYQKRHDAEFAQQTSEDVLFYTLGGWFLCSER